MDASLQIALCEDLPEDRERMQQTLAACKLPFTLASFQSGEEFLAAYHPRQFDLVFFDIYMDGMTGVETATELRKLDPSIPIAFTTTSLDYALESYRLSAIKYIEKPVTASALLPVLQMVLMQKQYVAQITVRNKLQEIHVPIDDILYLEQSGARFHLHLINGETITATGKLSSVTPQLDEALFYPCHKSYIVNFNYVKALNKELQVFEMTQGENVHIRRDSFWKTKRAYEAFLFGHSTSGTVSTASAQGGIHA